MTTRQFSPSEISQDWNRFSSSFFTVTHADGSQLGGGMLELAGLSDQDDLDTEEPLPRDIEWYECHIAYHGLNNNSMERGSYRMRHGDVFNFCPKWRWSGYTTVPNGVLRRARPTSAAGDTDPAMVWLSLAAARQYHYGLSARTFVARDCTSFYSLGRPVQVYTRDLIYLYNNGPVFHSGPITPTPEGLALTPTLGLHYVSEGVGALCWNALRVIGWHIDGAFRVEESARKLTHSLENVTYDSTEELSGLWASRIFPGRFSLGTDISTPTGVPAGGRALGDRPQGRPATLDPAPTSEYRVFDWDGVDFSLVSTSTSGIEDWS
jgi:hypothetical protein